MIRNFYRLNSGYKDEVAEIQNDFDVDINELDQHMDQLEKGEKQLTEVDNALEATRISSAQEALQLSFVLHKKAHQK